MKKLSLLLLFPVIHIACSTKAPPQTQTVVTMPEKISSGNPNLQGKAVAVVTSTAPSNPAAYWVSLDLGTGALEVFHKVALQRPVTSLQANAKRHVVYGLEHDATHAPRLVAFDLKDHEGKPSLRPPRASIQTPVRGFALADGSLEVLTCESAVPVTVPLDSTTGHPSPSRPLALAAGTQSKSCRRELPLVVANQNAGLLLTANAAKAGGITQFLMGSDSPKQSNLFSQGYGHHPTQPTDIRFSFNGEHLLVAGGDPSVLDVYRRRAPGMFSLEQRGLIPSFTPLQQLGRIKQIVFVPGDRFVYVLRSKPASLSGFEVDAETGSLVGFSNIQLKQDLDAFISVDPTGKYLVLAAREGMLTTAAISEVDGALSPTGHLASVPFASSAAWTQW